MSILNKLPLFPVSVIVFPGEIQPLHIFEPRYKQLIHEVEESGASFGIPFVKDGEISTFGSVVVLHKILATSPGGEMDVLVKGVQLFRIRDMVERMPDKPYGGGSVDVFNDLEHPASDDLLIKFIEYQKQMAEVDKSKNPVQITVQPQTILEIIKNIPMELDEKYAFLQNDSNDFREDFLLNKLDFLLMISKKLVEVGYRFYLN